VLSDESARARAGYGDRLAASRRIDWRFLLPEPDLGHVGCSATADPALLRACELFSESFTILDGDVGAPSPSSLDVVVLRDPEPEALTRTIALLRPNGWVYVEMHGVLTRGGRRLRGPRFPSDFVGKLRRLGFEDIESFWHWPNFETCTQLLPLGDPAVIRSALVRRQESRGRSPQVSLARLLLAGRLLPFAVTHASVIGRRPTDIGRF
jgi:hypothetical protein